MSKKTIRLEQSDQVFKNITIKVVVDEDAGDSDRRDIFFDQMGGAADVVFLLIVIDWAASTIVVACNEDVLGVMPIDGDLNDLVFNGFEIVVVNNFCYRPCISDGVHIDVAILDTDIFVDCHIESSVHTAYESAIHKKTSHYENKYSRRLLYHMDLYEKTIN